MRHISTPTLTEFKCQVVLKHLDGDESTEVVCAKYVVGADGA